MDDLLKLEILGGGVCVCVCVKAHTATMQFQKRGLPHVHILLIMDAECKPKTTEMIDNSVSAEIPDRDPNLKLYELITTQNIHEPKEPLHGSKQMYQKLSQIISTEYKSHRKFLPSVYA